MKSFIKFTAFALALGLTVTGCKREKIDFGGEQPSQDEIGYLVLAGMNLDLNAEIQETRTPVIAPDSYLVSIKETSTHNEVYSSTYGEIQALTSPISLQAGSYRIEARSCEVSAEPIAAFDKPVYTGSVTATILKRQTTTVSDLVCKLSNIKTTVYLDDALKSLFLADGTDDLRTDVTLGDNTLRFTKDETRAGYFKAIAENNTLTIVLQGSYNTAPADEAPVYKHVSMTKTINNVRAGQWRKISISVQHADEGNVTFVVEVETWVEDGIIDVDVMSSKYTFGEEIIQDGEESDPDSPVVTLGNNHDITAPFIINSAIFNDEGYCTDRIEAEIKPVDDATITSIKAEFDSDNAAFLEAIANATFSRSASTPIDMLNGVIVNGTTYVSVKDSGTTKILTASSAAMKTMFDNYEGTHTVKFIVQDSKNRTSYTPMTIQVKKSSGVEEGPSIVWQNHDLDTRYSTDVLTETDADGNIAIKDGSVVINITSSSTITGFLVDISGDVLTDNDLNVMGLASSMDLVNPATDKMSTGLQNLGFPVGDQVKKSTLSFDISQFMPLLAQLGIPGNCNFKLTVTDDSGTNAKTIMVSVPAN